MAVVFPDKESLLDVQLSNAERHLLDFFKSSLNDEYEVYLKPFINGDRPDMMIMKKYGGVLIVNVCEWKLDDYEIDEQTVWHLKGFDTTVKSPLSQVKFYKDNLYQLHIKGLLQKCFRNRYYRNIVSPMVYFHHENVKNIRDFLLHDFENGNYNSYKIFLKYIECWGKGSLTVKTLDSWLNRSGFNIRNDLFDDELYQNFKYYLQPKIHLPNEGKIIRYSKEKKALIRSESKPRRKIKGLAGGGKTFVLAKRAVNAYLRTKKCVLILCYNLSLKNHIRDRINEIQEQFSYHDFYITNYHQFFRSQANNYHLEIDSLKPFTNTGFFEQVRFSIKKFQTILIDEVQDYKTEWLEIITDYFLADDGEFVVFGDEKQNTYNRPLDDNLDPIIKTIRGTWNRSLIVSKRFTNRIGRLALLYQKELLSKKYNIDEREMIENPTIDFNQEILAYTNFGKEANTGDLYHAFKNLLSDEVFNRAQVTLLSAQPGILRELDYLIRRELTKETTTTFESEEYYEKLKFDFPGIENFHKEIESIRKNKRNHFQMKAGKIILSDIRSFKGWESETVILIIESEDESDKYSQSIELIYSGITRAQKNLYVFNMGNDFYDGFFRINIE